MWVKKKSEKIYSLKYLNINKIFLKPKNFWGFGFGYKYFWVLGLGFGFGYKNFWVLGLGFGFGFKNFWVLGLDFGFGYKNFCVLGIMSNPIPKPKTQFFLGSKRLVWCLFFGFGFCFFWVLSPDPNPNLRPMFLWCKTSG